MKLKYLVNKIDVIESCTREKINSDWRLYKQTNLDGVAASSSRTYVSVAAGMLFYLNLFWKTAQATVPSLKRKESKNTKVICLFFFLLRFIWTKIRSWKKKYQSFSICSSIEMMVSILLTSKESKWTLFQLLRTCWTWEFLVKKKTIWTEKVYVNLLGGVHRCFRILSDSWETLILYFTWSTLRQSNSTSVALIVKIFCERTSYYERHLTSCSEQVKHVYLKNVSQIVETLLTSWTLRKLKTRTSRPFSGIYCFLVLNPFVCMKGASKKLIPQKGLENIIPSQSLFRQTLSSNRVLDDMMILLTS